MRRLIISPVIGLALIIFSGISGWRLPSLGPGLWCGDLLGWFAYVLSALLMLLPVRGRLGVALIPISYRAHRLAGYATLALCILHAAVILLAEPDCLHYLLPGAPIYMLTGLAALALLFALCATSEPFLKRRFHSTSAAFRNSHVLLACAVLLLAFSHAVGSSSIPFTEWRALPWAILSALAVLAVLRPEHRTRPTRT